MILFFILLTLGIIIGKHIYEIHNFNYEAILQQLQVANKEEIFDKMKQRNPLLIHNLGNKNEYTRNININNLIIDNPGYIIHNNLQPNFI